MCYALSSMGLPLQEALSVAGCGRHLAHIRHLITILSLFHNDAASDGYLHFHKNGIVLDVSIHRRLFGIQLHKIIMKMSVTVQILN